MTCEAQMGDDPIAGQNLLGHDDLQVWDGSKKRFRGGGGSRRSLRTAGRQSVVNEALGDRLPKKRVIFLDLIG